MLFAIVTAFACGALVAGVIVHLQGLARQARSEADLRAQYLGADGGPGGPLQQSLAPINDKLQMLSVLVDQTRNSQTNISEQFAVVQNAAADLQKETRTLNQVFNNSQARGAWGEMQLRRIVELSGMVNRVDFEEQTHVATLGTNQRPDMVIRLDQGRTIVLDAKFPLNALLGSELSESGATETSLERHGRLVRGHIDTLSKKDYSKQFEQSPEFVIMFIPAESLLADALRADPSLFEYASARNVIPATPTTLLAILRSVALGWRNYQLAENATEILREAQELANRLATAYGHFDKVGASLNKAVESYNQTIGSWESRLTPQAERLQALELEPSKVVELKHVDLLAKSPSQSTETLEGAS